MDKSVQQFLDNDTIDLKSPNFNTTQFIANLLTDVKKRENLNNIYDEFIAKENECEDLINLVIEERYNKFSELLKKPQVYGEKYECLNQMARQSRRRIAKSKELLCKKQENLKQIHMEAIYNKEIVQLMNKIYQARQSLQVVENQIHNVQFYDACFELKRLKSSLDSFDLQRQKTPLIQQLTQNIESKQKILLQSLKNTFKKFFYGYSGKLLAIQETKDESAFSFDRLSSITVSNKNFILSYQKLTTMKTKKDFQSLLKDCLLIDLSRYDEIEEKNALLSICLQEQTIQVDDDPYQDLKSVSHDQLRKYIGYIQDSQLEYCFKFDDFNQVKNLVKTKTNKFGDVLVNHKLDNSLLSFFLMIKGTFLIRITDQILAEHFQDIKNDLKEYVSIQMLFMIKRILKKNKRQVQVTDTNNIEHLLRRLNFEQIDLYQIVTEFFKMLISNCVIIIRKHLILGSVIDFFEIELDEQTQVMSISQLYMYIIHDLHFVFNLFYKQNDMVKKDHFNPHQELIIIVHQILSKVIKPSCIYMLLQHHLIKDSIFHLHKCIGTYMTSPECILHEPFVQQTKDFMHDIDNSYQLGIAELQDHFKINCKEFMARFYKHDKQLCPILNELKGDWFTFFNVPQNIDNSLKAMLKKEFEQLKYFQDISFIIPEYLFFIHNLQVMCIFNQVIPLDTQMLSLLNWSMNVLAQETKYKMQCYVRGSCSENFIHNTDKVKLLKKSYSYLSWKIQFIQCNKLLNDGINTQDRLEQAQKNKQFKREYKQQMKQSYRDYFSGKLTIKEEQLIRSKESLQVFTSIHEHLHGFITVSTKIFEDYLSKIEEDQLIKKLGLTVKDAGPSNNPLLRKISIIKRFKEQMDVQSYKIPQDPLQKNLNVLEQKFNDDFSVSIFRFMFLLEALLELQKQCYFILRFEVHNRALCHLLHDKDENLQQETDQFSSNNIQNFYFDAFNFCSNLEENLRKENVKLIISDFWTILKLSIKMNFVRSHNSFKKKKVQLLLKDFSLLQSELKTLTLFVAEDKKINKCFGTLRRYIKLYLINALELEKFLKINPFKYKSQEVKEFLEIRGPTDIKSDNASEFNTKIIDIIKKYCL